jgi:dTDP-4-dehydrorhamnose reductase
MTPRPLTILVLGRSGQVAQALKAQLGDLGNLHVLGRDQLDLAHPERISEQVRALAPHVIINAAAYTAVDQAEKEEELAQTINGVAPGILAEEAARSGALLIHYSSDYVFDGRKPSPYTEDDPACPLSVYGRSKLAGERAIAAVGGSFVVLRTSWVYSLQGRNFLLTMQRLLQDKPELRIVADQIGAPTWAGTIAQVTQQLVERWRDGQAGEWGVYHMTGLGETSWFGFAEKIGEHLREQGHPCAQLTPIPSSDYPTPATRPLNSRLDCSRLQAQWGVQLPKWDDALTQCLAAQQVSN